MYKVKKRHNVANNIKKFHKMIKNGQVVFDSPIQRDDNQWSIKQKSKLIRSILLDYSIPPVYSIGIQNDDKREMIYSILDGKQRLTSLTEFIDGKFEIKGIEPVEIEGTLFNLKGLTFEKLPDELQDAILDYSLSMVYYVYLTNDEIAEMFDLLNGGTPLSRQQKANAFMGMDSARRMKELKNHAFFSFNAALPSTQHIRAEDAEAITQAMMIIDPDYALMSFGSRHMDDYSASLKTGKEHLFEEMGEILDYVHLALDFYTDKTVLKKTLIPMVLAIGKIAKDQKLEPDLFLQWIQEFKLSIENKGKIKINYQEYMGTGSFSRNKVHGRLNSAKRHYMLFCKNEKFADTDAFIPSGIEIE